MRTLLKYLQKALFISTCLLITSCSSSKVITTPTKIVAGVASIIPVVGDKIDKGLTKSADIIDIIYE